MQLFIKQKLLSFNDQFTVYDSNQQVLYRVRGELLSLGKKLHITTDDGREIALVTQKLLTYRPRFLVYIGGRRVAQILREMTLVIPKYDVIGPGWRVKGDFLNHNYEIFGRRNSSIARITKKWLSWGDTYCIDVPNPSDVILAMCVALTIDCVDAERQASQTQASMTGGETTGTK
ncbi:MAG: LURP-one-related family protein [Eubacteriaceae bacterium]|nr:LURP-one-related family protein [Eubacteriaceae bacterium]